MLKRKESSKWTVLWGEKLGEGVSILSSLSPWPGSLPFGKMKAIHCTWVTLWRNAHTKTCSQFKAERQTLRGFSRQRVFLESEANREAKLGSD